MTFNAQGKREATFGPDREGRPPATPETTGPGAVLTDGRGLLEVRGERRRAVVVGKGKRQRTLSILERLVGNATASLEPDKDDPEERWRPMAELRDLHVVRAAASEAAAGEG